MTRFIVLRHGQSVGNTAQVFNGNVDMPLSELGRKQAELTAELLRNESIDLAFASTLSRAFDTAVAVAKLHGIAVTPDPAFCEIDGGEWEGHPYAEAEKTHPEAWALWYHDPAKCRCPGGESLIELRDRVKAEFDRLACEYPEKTILIGTHATPVRVMTSVWNYVPFEKLGEVQWVPNASVTIVDYLDNGDYRVEVSGKCDHLGELVTKLPKI